MLGALRIHINSRVIGGGVMITTSWKEDSQRQDLLKKKKKEIVQSLSFGGRFSFD
jgi:hypothetical protein